MAHRYSVQSLLDFTHAVNRHAGLSDSTSRDIARILVEGDLLGHDTHGLQLLTPYLNAFKSGAMLGDGDPQEITRRLAIANWDGRYLPGPYLTLRAIETAKEMSKQCGTGTVVIRQSSHIGALAAYLEEPAREGYLIQIVCADPSVASVAPFGGSEPLFTPNPMAWGIPTSHDPIMIDISASITTNGMSGRLHEAGETGDHDWWLDASGQPCNTPSVIFQNPPGSLLPLGGIEAGHKGFGLALFVEAMTAGLSGYGRADEVENWGATVYVQVSDIEAFCDRGAFDRQMDYLVERCLQSTPADPDKPVRVPGQRGLARKAEQMKQGIQLHPSIMPALLKLADNSGVALPVEV